MGVVHTGSYLFIRLREANLGLIDPNPSAGRGRSERRALSEEFAAVVAFQPELKIFIPYIVAGQIHGLE